MTTQCSWLSCQKKQRQQASLVSRWRNENLTSMWSAVCDVRIKHDGKKTRNKTGLIKAFRTLVWKSSQRFFFLYKHQYHFCVIWRTNPSSKKTNKKKVFYVLTTKHCIVSGCIREELQATIIKTPKRLCPRSTRTQWEWSRGRPASSSARILTPPPKRTVTMDKSSKLTGLNKWL